MWGDIILCYKCAFAEVNCGKNLYLHNLPQQMRIDMHKTKSYLFTHL